MHLQKCVQLIWRFSISRLNTPLHHLNSIALRTGTHCNHIMHPIILNRMKCFDRHIVQHYWYTRQTCNESISARVNVFHQKNLFEADSKVRIFICWFLHLCCAVQNSSINYIQYLDKSVWNGLNVCFFGTNGQ